jgi:hypothetical protein
MLKAGGPGWDYQNQITIFKPANLTIHQGIQQEDTYLNDVFMLKFGICRIKRKYGESHDKR